MFNNELENIITMCKGGFKHNEIVIESMDNGESKQMTYSNLKGVYIAKNKESFKIENEIIIEEFKELWLTQKGELVVFDSICRKDNKSEYIIHIRRSVSKDQNINQFEMEKILFGIKKALERKMNSIQNKVERQQEKINKINQLIKE